MTDKPAGELRSLDVPVDVNVWYSRHRRKCPTCGIDLTTLNPMANIVPHWEGTCSASPPAASEPQASEREAALREAATALQQAIQDSRILIFKTSVSELVAKTILALIGQTAPRPDARTLERVREVLSEHSCTVAIRSHPQIKTKCKCGWERLHVLADADRTWLLWIEHIVALLAAPETEKP